MYLTKTYIILIPALLCGCPPRKPPDIPGQVRPEHLPNDVGKLLTFAKQRRAGRFNPLRYADSLVALTKARKLSPTQAEVLARGAWVCRALAERARTKGGQLKYADKGLVFTAAGRKHHPARVVFHYLHAALLGLRVDAYRAKAFSVVPQIVKAARRAMSIDKRFDHGGPPRVLGSLLASVPASPPFNGDLEQGLKLLREAVAVAPGYPMNHFFLAEALAKDDETEAAARHFARVICARTGPSWDPDLARKYVKRARQGLEKLKRSGRPKCP